MKHSYQRSLTTLAMALASVCVAGATCIEEPPVQDAGSEPEPQVEPAPAVDAGPPDTAGPLVTFLAPENRCLEGIVPFRFRVVDEGVGTGFVSAQFAGTAIELTPGSTDEAEYLGVVDTSGLFVGLKDLVVAAIDTQNNATEARRTFAVSDGVTYLEDEEFTCGTPPDPPPDDINPPTVVVVSPIANFEVFENASFALTVEATDDVGPLTVVARAGGNEVVLTSVTNDRFSGTISLEGLAEGPIDVVITATDAASRTATASRSITIDRTAPTVVIVEPQNGAEREWLNDVVALVNDNNAVERVTLFEQGVVDDLGSATAPLEGTNDRFGIIHELACVAAPRDLTFVVEGRDRAGNVGQDTVDVTIRVNAQCN